jgi:hypothetical protein
MNNVTAYNNPPSTYWMLLFIDSDQNKNTGWEGYDYVVNMPSSIGGTTQTALAMNVGNVWNSVVVNSNVPMRYYGNEIDLSILRSDVGMSSPQSVDFDFHWADNIQIADDVIEFARSGDSAPDRRCNYHFISAH